MQPLNRSVKVRRPRPARVSRLETLEPRVLLDAGMWPGARAAATAFLPHGITRNDLVAAYDPEANRPGRGPKDYGAIYARPGGPPGGFTSLIVVDEDESNDTIGTANGVPLGDGPGLDVEVDVLGTLGIPGAATPSPIPQVEDDGSIPLANPTGLTTGSSVIASGFIGDGPFGPFGPNGPDGFLPGDFDFFAIDASAGERITADVDAFFIGSSLDPMLAVFNSSGDQIAFNDDFDFLDSFIQLSVPADDTYYVAVAGFFNLPNDPFDSSSGFGGGLTGFYDLTLTLDQPDIDHFAFELAPGDVFSANVFGGASHLTLYAPDGTELIGSGQNVTFAHPVVSPLRGDGNAALSYVVPEAGTYTIAVNQGSGDYGVQLRTFRPALEAEDRGTRQSLFLDFDGAIIDAAAIFGFGNSVANLSPLSSYLAGWGLSVLDENAVIDAIVASVTESFADIGLFGNNGDFASDGIDGNYGIAILNSRDHPDRFGDPNVSRVIVGGSIPELGIGTIGIAESIDVGNFDTSETAVVLLDLLSGPAFDPNSLNQFFDPTLGMSIVSLVGAGVGNIVAHEAGHFFAAWHTEQFNATLDLMDQGGNLPNIVGVGPDGIFGTDDDVRPTFGIDTYVPNEGFTGVQDGLNALAFGLSTGTVDAGQVVLASDPADGSTVFGPAPTTFVIDVVDPVDPATVDPADLTVNGVPADGVAISDDGERLTFTFATSPAFQGAGNVVAVADDAFTRISDGDGVEAFTATFRYDAIQIAPVTLSPPDGAIVSLPFSRLRVTFNEPYAPSSIGTDDLSLSLGSVVGVNLIDTVTVEYLLELPPIEGPLSVAMADGAVLDVFGNVGLGFTASYTLDFGTVAFPVPLLTEEPSGSLIYERTVSGGIGTPVDTDTFRITADPGQTISVVVTPDVGLRPTVRITDDRGRLVASATATSAGIAALIQTFPVPGSLLSPGGKPRTYLISVSGSGGTTGAYSARVVLNAAVEREGNGGPSNDTRATAQNVMGSFINLDGTNSSVNSTRPHRGAVLGSLSYNTVSTVFHADFETGTQGFTVDNDPASSPDPSFYIPGLWHLSTGRGAQLGHSGTTSFYYGSGEGPDGGGSYQSGTANPSFGAITSPSIDLPTTSNLLLLDFNYVLQTRGVPNDVDFASIEINAGAGWTTLERYDRVAESLDWRTAEPLDITAYAGQSVQFRWTFDTRRGPVGRAPEGWYVDDVRIREATLTDLYRIDLRNGQGLTLAAAALGGGAVRIELLDSAGNVVAEGLQNPQLIVNGSFETGDFTGWTTITTGDPFVPWTVSGAGFGTGFFPPTEPQDGAFVAWNGFDGFGPMEYVMYQDVAIPADTPFATLSWKDRVQWDFALTGGTATEPRIYEVQVVDPADGSVLETISSFSTGTDPIVGDTGWQSHSADLSAYLGRTIRLVFRESIPEVSTGPGQIEFDAISLRTSDEVMPTNVSDLIRNFVATANGTYYVRVTGDPGTDYSVVATLNADFSIEGNDSFESAQEIGPDRGGRKYVLGAIGGGVQVVLNAFDQGWWTDFGFHDAFETNYFAGYAPGFAELRNFFAFNVPTIDGQVIDAELRVFNPAYTSGDPTETYVVFDVSTPIGELIGGASEGRTDIFADLGSGESYGSRVFSAADNSSLVTIGLNDAALAAILAAQGGQFAVGGALSTIDFAGGEQSVFGFSNGSLQRELVLSLAEADYYRVSAGENARIVVELDGPAAGSGEFVNGLIPKIEIFDQDGNLVASHVHGGPLSASTARLEYRVPRGAGGSYFIVISGVDGTTGEYVLSVDVGGGRPASPLRSAGQGANAAAALGGSVGATTATANAAGGSGYGGLIAPEAGDDPVAAPAPPPSPVVGPDRVADMDGPSPILSEATEWVAVGNPRAEASSVPGPATPAPVVQPAWGDDPTVELVTPTSPPVIVAAEAPAVESPVASPPVARSLAFELGLAGLTAVVLPDVEDIQVAADAPGSTGGGRAIVASRTDRLATVEAPSHGSESDLAIDRSLEDVALSDAMSLDRHLRSRRKVLLEDGRGS